MATSLDTFIDVCIKSFDQLFSFIRGQDVDMRDQRELLIHELNKDFPRFLETIGCKIDLENRGGESKDYTYEGTIEVESDYEDD